MVNDALKKVGSDNWAYGKKRGKFEKNTNKCNLFVEEMLLDNGYTVPRMNGILNNYGPVAGQWGNPLVDIPGYSVVTSPQPGDIVAEAHNYSNATGHVGIVSGSGTSVSQSSLTNTVVNNDWGFRPANTPVFRRCDCK